MVVRGAPAIAVTAAWDALAAKKFRPGRVREDFEKAARTLVPAPDRRQSGVDRRSHARRARRRARARRTRLRERSPRG
jgi:methylthioribose-1-phosphate isomerase